jgi:hypothetical protein
MARLASHWVYPEDRRLPGEVVLTREDFKPMATVLEKHMKARQFFVVETKQASPTLYWPILLTGRMRCNCSTAFRS